MTDDKGASEGPYAHIPAAGNRDWCISVCPKCAYEDGQKAERERCADIARQHFSCEGIAQDIEKQIMGGQDAK